MQKLIISYRLKILNSIEVDAEDIIQTKLSAMNYITGDDRNQMRFLALEGQCVPFRVS